MNYENNNEIFDRAALLDRVGGDEKFFNEIVELFFCEAPELIDSIQKAIEENDRVELHRNAHTLKGSAGNMSAKELQQLALQLEKISKEGDLLYAKQLLDEIKNRYEKFRQQINSNVEELV